MVHAFAHEVNVGVSWAKKPYCPDLPLFDKHGWVTHTVVIGFNQNPEGKDDPCTFCDSPRWVDILEACGFCTRSEAKRRGFSGEAPIGFSEKRVASNMVLYVWRACETIDETPE